jgi:hypothetical protein
MVVYKWTDADGVVHFSDQPVPGAERIVTAGGTTRGILSQSAPKAPVEKPKTKGSPLDYTQFTITSPGEQETFTGNPTVMVSLALEPSLKANQTITWTLNGVQVNQPPDAVKFTLSDLARGSYTLTATLTDQPSGESKSADPLTFFVVRPSTLSPQHK